MRVFGERGLEEIFGSIELCRLVCCSSFIVAVENDVRGLVLKEEEKKARKVLVLRKGFVVGLAGDFGGADFCAGRHCNATALTKY